MSLVAGIGCQKGSPTEAILAAIDAALLAHGRSRAELSRLATLPEKAGEAGLVEASRRLGLPLAIPTRAELAESAPGCLTHSAASEAATGLPSASEAAALAASGGGALLGARLALGPVTCALAEILR